MKKRYLFAIFGLLLVLLVVVQQIPMASFWGAPIAISRETTRLVEPRLPGGGIDYLKAINDEFSAGVTPGKNALVELLTVIHIETYNEEYHQPFVELLGVPEMPPKQKYLVSPWEFAVSTVSDPKQRDQQIKELRQLVRRPWSSQQYPWWRKWVDEYEGSFDTVVAASQKSHCYLPIVWMAFTGDEGWTATYPEVARECLGPIQDMRMRVMNALGDGDTASAFDDIQALHRLAALYGQSASFSDYVVAATIDRTACDLAAVLLEQGDVTDEQIQQYRDLLDTRMPMISMARRANHFERFAMLACIQSLAFGEAPSSCIRGLIERETMEGIFQQWIHLTNWNAALLEVNRLYDRFVKILEEPDDVTRLQKFKLFESELEQEKLEQVDQTWFVLGGSRFRGTIWGRALVAAQLGDNSWTESLICAEIEQRMQMDLLNLGFAMEQYKQVANKYPAQLTELIPTYMESLPIDRFTGGPLIYRQTEAGYIVYSVGEDLEDDGGKNSDEAHDRKGDIIFRIGESKFVTIWD